MKNRLLAIQALEAIRALEEGVLVDVREGDVGAILGWGFAPVVRRAALLGRHAGNGCFRRPLRRPRDPAWRTLRGPRALARHGEQRRDVLRSLRAERRRRGVTTLTAARERFHAKRNRCAARKSRLRNELRRFSDPIRSDRKTLSMEAGSRPPRIAAGTMAHFRAAAFIFMRRLFAENRRPLFRSALLSFVLSRLFAENRRPLFRSALYPPSSQRH